MKTCPECKIEVGGNEAKCPLCGAELEGTGTNTSWPERKELKRVAAIYRLQFAMIMIAGLAYMVKMILEGNALSGVILLLWLFEAEVLLMQIVSRRFRAKSLILGACLAGVVLLLITGLLHPEVLKAVPILFIIILALSCIFTLTDRSGQSLVYFLITCLVLAASWVTAAILFESEDMHWMACLITAGIAFGIMLIVNGRRIFLELRKKVNF